MKYIVKFTRDKAIVKNFIAHFKNKPTAEEISELLEIEINLAQELLSKGKVKDLKLIQIRGLE